MNKQIAFITNGYADNNFSSGGVKLNFMLLQKFVEAGYSIDVYSKKYYNISGAKGIKIFRFYDFKSPVGYDFVLSGNAVYAADVTYIHDHTNIFRFKHMYSPLFQILYKIFKPKDLKYRLNEDIERNNVLHNTKKIIVSSEILKRDYIENYGLPEDKFVLLPPPVILKSQIQKRQSDKDFVFGLSAVGFERKGGYITLKAAAKLKKLCKNFKVKIIYPQKNFFINFLIKLYNLQDNVEFIGCQADMSAFYNDIDCLLMPSKVEPFGMVATEAMSFGKPVILSKICGAADFIKSGNNGFVVDNNKNYVANLVNAMLEMINLPRDKYNEMSKNALNSVNGFDISDFSLRYTEVMEKLKQNT